MVENQGFKTKMKNATQNCFQEIHKYLLVYELSSLCGWNSAMSMQDKTTLSFGDIRPRITSLESCKRFAWALFIYGLESFANESIYPSLSFVKTLLFYQWAVPVTNAERLKWITIINRAITVINQHKSKHDNIVCTFHIDCLMQGRSISSTLVMEILQSCTKPSICFRYEWEYPVWAKHSFIVTTNQDLLCIKSGVLVHVVGIYGLIIHCLPGHVWCFTTDEINVTVDHTGCYRCKRIVFNYDHASQNLTKTSQNRRSIDVRKRVFFSRGCPSVNTSKNGTS